MLGNPLLVIFQHFIDRAQEEGPKGLRGNHRGNVTKILDWGKEHGYTVILQYLFTPIWQPVRR